MSTSASIPSLGSVCVIGGCGFLGHHIVKLLHSRHPETTISVIDLRTSNNRIDSPKISYHEGDLTSYDSIKALFSKLKLDAVIHTASPVPTQAGMTNELLYKVNVDGTKNLLKAAQETGIKAFVYTSSASVVCSKDYGVVNADETWPVVSGEKQPDYYSSTKALAEIAVLEANRQPNNFLTCALRPAGIFGEGDRQILSKIMQAYFDRNDNVQIGPNDNLMDYTYVVNVAHAHLLAAQALLATHKILPTIPLDHERVDGEAFFVTNDEPVYWWDFARGIWGQCGPNLPLNKIWVLSRDLMMVIATLTESFGWLGFKTGHLTRQVVYYATLQKFHNIDKAKRRLGYKPLVGLDEGVRRGVGSLLAEKEWQEKLASEKKRQ